MPNTTDVAVDPKTRKLRAAASIALAAILLIAIVVSRSKNALVYDTPTLDDAHEPVPRFSQIEDITERKRAYFSYLKPAIALQNEHLLALRDYVQQLQEKLSSSGDELNELDLRQALQVSYSKREQDEVLWLLQEYRVDENQSAGAAFTQLLSKIDIIPEALVLIQSANESAWGTSRFAKEGYNFFGIWCFSEGCGFVPKRRNKGAIHEVAKYNDLSHAMYEYMLNLNRHPAYDDLRAIRKNLREQGKRPTALELIQGLEQYSERGHEYVEELEQMIKTNQELI
ncbi:glucosaminidase domain-containing protein [Ningiella sp. W23]|uniref:glucosaminidase domain-containing protein n=1 Tax=Ningiella sp. W23 TaxID=3023715 RepID=UPI00375820B0